MDIWEDTTHSTETSRVIRKLYTIISIMEPQPVTPPPYDRPALTDEHILNRDRLTRTLSTEEKVDILKKITFYHRIPKGMTGPLLQPLNTLSVTHPQAADVHKTKYDNRPHLLTRQVDANGLLWNDHLFLTTVDPRTILSIKRKYFQTEPEAFYVIPGHMLDVHSLLFYQPVFTQDGFLHQPPQYHDVSSLDMNSEQIPKMIDGDPALIEAYFKRFKDNDRKPLTFATVLHCLYPKEIDTQGLSIMTV